MSKAILVIDVDEKVLNNDVTIIKFANDTAYYCNERLKPMPQAKQIFFGSESEIYKNIGWNACIDELLGEE